ncbi:Os01g0781833 [Oryza sativa Japonica Group]|uniref:Os01g0781600 protein n=1 Tax=Oryza sativa subsp. japonica TaxID=39947 RepID=A0A0P0V8Z7_ORYSJ|nr:Os01g0781600 [Oryza sativa Japonica Group]BAS74653.1 Os01g0781833 [Oryza sativa Japonica Group]
MKSRRTIREGFKVPRAEEQFVKAPRSISLRRGSFLLHHPRIDTLRRHHQDFGDRLIFRLCSHV